MGYKEEIYLYIFKGGTSRSRVRNRANALVPLGKALNLITSSIGEDNKTVGPMVVYLKAYSYFLNSQGKHSLIRYRL